MQLKCSLGSMKLTVKLIISLLSESLKSDFLNKNVLIAEVSFCAKIFGSIEGIFLFFKKGPLLRCMVCVMETKMNNRLDTITTTTTIQRV